MITMTTALRLPLVSTTTISPQTSTPPDPSLIDCILLHSPGVDDTDINMTSLDDTASSSSWSVIKFSTGYQSIHGYVSAIVCLFGVAANVSVVGVLTRPRMRRSPTNFLLGALAIADLLTMSAYLPYAVYFYCITTPDQLGAHRRASIVFLIVVINVVITAHTAAMWLTVAVALFRYLAVGSPRPRHTAGSSSHTGTVSFVAHAPVLGGVRRRMRHVRIATVGVLVVTAILCAPNYFLYRPVEVGLSSSLSSSDDQSVCLSPAGVGHSSTAVNESSISSSDNQLGYWFTDNPFVTSRHKTINFWLYGVTLKICPCVILTIVSILLVRTVHYAELRRRIAHRQQSVAVTAANSTTTDNNTSSNAANQLGRAGRGRRRRREHARTTAMLVAVALCFVVAELPNGILAFWSGVDRAIFDNLYVPLGDVWDIVSLVNSAVNFLLYCTMSRNFRETFVDVFRHVIVCRRWTAGPDNNALNATSVGGCRRNGGGGGGHSRRNNHRMSTVVTVGGMQTTTFGGLATSTAFLGTSDQQLAGGGSSNEEDASATGRTGRDNLVDGVTPSPSPSLTPVVTTTV